MTEANETDVSVEGILETVPVNALQETFSAPPLTKDEAQHITETIRNAAEALWVLLARAHAGKAWQALGYDTWEKYVRTEFDMSRSRSYQLLDQARVITAIESAVPDGTEIKLSEAAARDLKNVLDEVVPEIADKTANVTAEEATEIVAEIVETRRETTNLTNDDSIVIENGRVRDVDPTITYEPLNEPEVAAYEPKPVLPDTPAPAVKPLTTPSVAAPDQVDVAKIRRNVNAAHDLYSSLSALAGLPDTLEEIIAIIPAERKAQVQSNLAAALENLNRFAEIWNETEEN